MRNRSAAKSSQRFDVGVEKWYPIIRKGNIMFEFTKEELKFLKWWLYHDTLLEQTPKTLNFLESILKKLGSDISHIKEIKRGEWDR